MSQRVQHHGDVEESLMMKKRQEVSLVRFLAAEYLALLAASVQGGVEAVYADESVWMHS